MAIPPSYVGRNSPKDVAARVWETEGTRLPALQAEIDAVEQLVQEENDFPSFTVLINAVLT